MNRWAAMVWLFTLGVPLSGCTALQQMAALRQVTFRFDRVEGVALAGVPVGPGADYSKVGAVDLARLAATLAEGRMPVRFTAHVAATNPGDNAVSARLVDFTWALFVEDRRTVDGLVSGATDIAPGTTADVPVDIELDLRRFFEGGLADLYAVAAGIAGVGDNARTLRLELVPTIETSIGAIRYPAPIVVQR